MYICAKLQVEVEYARIRDRKTGKVLSWEEANRDETLWSRALEYKVPEAPITNIIVNKAVRETPPFFPIFILIFIPLLLLLFV